MCIFRSWSSYNVWISSVASFKSIVHVKLSWELSDKLGQVKLIRVATHTGTSSIALINNTSLLLKSTLEIHH